MLKHVGSKWYVLDSSGKKVLGKHSTKEKAVKQLSAIEISKKEGNARQNGADMEFRSLCSQKFAQAFFEANQ